MLKCAAAFPMSNGMPEKGKLAALLFELFDPWSFEDIDKHDDDALAEYNAMADALLAVFARVIAEQPKHPADAECERVATEMESIINVIGSRTFVHMDNRESAAMSVEILRDAQRLLRAKQPEGETQRLRRVIERERTASATWIERIRCEIEKRRTISRSRGPYEWNDDAYFKEFGAALDAIETALPKAMRDTRAQDFTDCPTTNDEVQRARTE